MRRPAGIRLAPGILLIVAASLQAQISPGPLSLAHASLEGVTKCANCHDFGAGTKRFRCLECHLEIKQRLDTHTGFHTRAVKPLPGEADCARCHMEHNGQSFALTRLDRRHFDHVAQTGFALEGKHLGQKCESCHNAKNLPSEARSVIKVKDPARSFLGLRRDCAGCHKDIHAGQLGAACSNCHNQDSWSQAPGFNHARTPFQLTGLHQSVACAKCHLPQRQASAEKQLLFKGLSFSGCQSCHNDPHRGGFKDAKVRGGCETCHTTAGWKSNRPASGFDHANTKFPLTGAHAAKACAQCHKDSDFHRPIPHDKCGDCHQDVHSGQFTARPQGSDCASCHNDISFKPPLFNRETHRTAAFPLTAMHERVACAACHKAEGKATVWETRLLQCAGCHQDVHAGQFEAAPWTNQCSLCHNQSGFDRNSFSVERHAMTRFALKGRHEKVSCESCHKVLNPAPGFLAKVSTPARQFRFPSRACNTCHADPHRQGQKVAACENCHTEASWTSSLPFDHKTTRFPLTGRHVRVNCNQCHNPVSPGGSAIAKLAPAFSSTPTLCSGCHKDPHGGQFRKGQGRPDAPEEECSNCHTTSGWGGADFDHEKTRYPLDRAHMNVPCAKCHKNALGAERDSSARIRMFRGTAMECVSCH